MKNQKRALPGEVWKTWSGLEVYVTAIVPSQFFGPGTFIDAVPLTYDGLLDHDMDGYWFPPTSIHADRLRERVR